MYRCHVQHPHPCPCKTHRTLFTKYQKNKDQHYILLSGLIIAVTDCGRDNKTKQPSHATHEMPSNTRVCFILLCS